MTDINPLVAAKPIEVNGRIIDPKDHYAQDARNTNHIIIRVQGILSIPQRAELEHLQVFFLEDLGDNNLLCRYEPPNLQPLRDLEFVQHVDVYRNLFKIPEGLRSLIEELEKDSNLAADPTCQVDILVHQGVSDLNLLADSIANKLHLERDQLEIVNDKIRLETAVGQLEVIAADDRVRILEEVVTPTLQDMEATKIVCAPVQMPGYSGFRGTGQIIAVADTGFDLGSVDNCHPAFAQKIQKLIPVGRASKIDISEAEKVADPQGHGTHVCGTIVGQEIETSQGFIGGVASGAKLVVSSLLADNRDLMAIGDVQSLFLGPYKDHGACVYSNSWGDGLGSGHKQRAYGSAAYAIDDFVRKNPDALICFSAGNNNATLSELTGKQKQSIGSQAAAKNCLTIGASGSTRKLSDQDTSIDPDKMCLDSSRGPTAENRTKPDVVAPGFNIFSAHSRHPAVRYGAAEAKSDNYRDTLWKVRSGTSHATPLVSGCAAILREILQSKGCQNPPAALLKAVIINGAEKLPGVDTEAQGFGRVNLQASATLLELPVLLARDIPIGTSLPSQGGTLIGKPLKQDQEFTFTLPPPEISEEDLSGSFGQPQLKVTMVYNDMPGGQIQNNLNLSVISSATDEIKHGGISEDEMDIQNNVEQVVWDSMPRVALKIRVRAQKIFPHAEQDFALAWSVAMPYEGAK